MSDQRQRTVPDSVGDLDAARRGRVGRRVFVVALGAFLVLALTGVLGGAQTTLSAQRGAHGTVPLLEGRPVVIVQHGRIREDVLRVERLPVEDVLEAARQQGIEDIAKVRIAVLEPGGMISFLKQA